MAVLLSSANREPRVYGYDGSFEGLLSAIFQSFVDKCLPADIRCERAQQALEAPVFVETDPVRAKRVLSGAAKISPLAAELMELGFLTCHPQKELLIDRYLRLALEQGKRIEAMLAAPEVAALQKAVGHLQREVHRYKGFIRFSDHRGVLVAAIEPENFVLPLLRPHFCDRYQNERFFILDKTHDMALAHRPGATRLLPAADFTPPEADLEEIAFYNLWRAFYNTIAIPERYNPRCRMNHIPKRYWKHLTEFAAPEIAVKRLEG